MRNTSCSATLAKFILQVSIQNLTNLCGARIFKLLKGPMVTIPQNRFLVRKSIPLWNWFLETPISCEGTEEACIFQNCRFHTVCTVLVRGRRPPTGQHISNTQKYGRGWKVDFCFKKLIFYGIRTTLFNTWFLVNFMNWFYHPKPVRKYQLENM
jgi:hypothetical protein